MKNSVILSLSRRLVSIPGLFLMLFGFFQTAVATQHCIESAELQKTKIVEFEQKRNSMLVGTKTAVALLKNAEESFRDFTKTGCENYLFESVSLYKDYYRLLEQGLFQRKPVNEFTRNEYQNWLERIESSRQQKSMSPFLLPNPSKENFFSELTQLQSKLLEEKLRVDRLITKRNKVLIPSVIAMAIGIPMVAVGGTIVSLNGKRYAGSCSFDGEPTPCVYDIPVAGYGVMIGLGAALTIGGATGLGVSLHQINQQQSPSAK